LETSGITHPSAQRNILQQHWEFLIKSCTVLLINP